MYIYIYVQASLSLCHVKQHNSYVNYACKMWRIANWSNDFQGKNVQCNEKQCPVMWSKRISVCVHAYVYVYMYVYLYMYVYVYEYVSVYI